MRKFTVNVNGKSYEVEVEEHGAAGAAPVAAPAPAAAPAGSTVVSAPMPGTILSIAVSAGQAVKSGDVLCILEAMKMENEIVAPCDGTVSAILTSQGASVNTDDKLIALG